MIVSFKDKKPSIPQSAFIAESADLIGDVRAGENCSFWYNVTVRADIAPVIIGDNSNIQDNSVIHVGHDVPAVIGSNVTVGHNAIIHACTIEDCSLIGMGAIILDFAVIGKESIVGAGALVTGKKKFPPRSLIMGSPARLVRELTEAEVEGIYKNTASYVEILSEYKQVRTLP